MTTTEKNVSLNEIDEATRNMAEQPMFNLLEGEEEESRRELCAKHFTFGAGRRQAVLFDAPVHYEGADGMLHEIDNTLHAATVNGRQVFRNADNPMQVEFPANADDNALVKLTRDGHELAWRFEQPVQAVEARIANGDALTRSALVERAAAMKADMPRLARAMSLADANVISTAALAEAVVPAGLDKDAFKAVMTAENIDTVDTSTLDKALRLPVERRMSRIEKQAELCYDQLIPGISARYTLTDVGVKEDIIVEHESALNSIALCLPDHYRYTIEEDQTVIIETNGETVFTFAPPRVYDANGSEEIATVSLENCDGYVRMTYVLSEGFLSNAVYPVTIDPVVKTGYKDSTALTDVYISTQNKTTRWNNTYLQCGHANGHEYISLIRFNKLIKQTASDTIISAYLRVIPEHRDGDTMYFACYPIETQWSTGTVSWNSMNPNGDNSGISKKVLSYITNISDYNRYFDITDLCRKWYRKDSAGNTQNFGVALRVPKGCGTSSYTYWKATTGSTSENPRLVINYISHAGLEDWWQYETMSAGRAGTAHVDIYNGNLVFDHPDVSSSGNLMPVSVAHYYNSCLSENNDYYCGYGWRTSMQQSLHVEKINSVVHYVWTDSDGTEHFFKKNDDNEYEDLEGMKLKLTFPNSTTARIISKDHSAVDFPKPATPSSGVGAKKYVSVMRDALNVADNNKGSKIMISYVSGKPSKISRLTDGAGRETLYQYNDTTDELLKKITAPDGSYVQFFYDSDQRLARVRYSDLVAEDEQATPIVYRETVYTYDGNILISAKNYDGLEVRMGFDPVGSFDASCIDNFAVQARKVISLETVNGSVAGAKQLFDYRNMTTKITSVKDSASDVGKTLTYQFNDSGNVTCMFDELGYAQATTFSSTIPNTESQSSKLQRAVMNYCPNVDFTGDLWSRTGNGTVASDGNNRCLGVQSAKFTGAATYSIQVPALAKFNDGRTGDQKYTFSCFIRRRGITVGDAYIRLKVNATSYFSRKVNEVTDNVSGGPGAEGWERVYVSAMIPDNATVSLELVFAGAAGSAWFACPQLETGSIPNRVNLLVNGDFGRTEANSDNTDATRLFPSGWTKRDGITTAVENCVLTQGHGMPDVLTGNALRMISWPNKASVAFTQSVNVSGVSGDTFVIGGWLNAESVAKIPTETSRKCAPCIAYRFVNGSTNGDWKYAEFSREWIGWQFGCWAIVATGDYTKIEFDVNYARNAQQAMFTNMFLHREQFGQSFAYDKDKNVLSVANLANTQSDIKYDKAHNVQSYVQPGAGADDKYSFSYGSTEAVQKKHLLQSSATPMAIEQKFEYDDKGNQTVAKTFKAPVTKDGAKWICHKEIIDGKLKDVKEEQTANEKVIGSKTLYTADTGEDALPAGIDKNYVHKSFDARGYAVTKTMDPARYTLSSVTDPIGQAVNYSYDDAKRVTEVSSTIAGTNGAADKVFRNQYTYENDRIRTVSHNTGNNNTFDVTYTFGYDDLGRKTDVTVHNPTRTDTPVLLSHNVYATDRSGLLKEVHYGRNASGQTGSCGKVIYEYDDFDRMTGVRYMDSLTSGDTEPRYTYEYGANGQVSFMEDKKLGQTKQVEYDLAERPCQATIRDTAGNLVYRTTLKYDKLNRLERFGEQTASGSHKTMYKYDKDNRTTRMMFDGAATQVEYKYDSMGRITDRKLTNGPSNYNTAYSYLGGSTSLYGAGATTPLVSGITQGSGGNAMNYGYTYDSRGNITKETRNGLVTKYGYDRIGELTWVSDPHENIYWTFTYDRGGNITYKRRYARNADGTRGALQDYVKYVYAAAWKDRLVRLEKYDASNTLVESINVTHNSIGNMTNDGERTYTWQAGRQLKKIVKKLTADECKACESGTDGGDMKLMITFSGSNVLDTTGSSVTATANVLCNTTDVTGTIAAGKFNWMRDSGNATADATWNNAHKGMKSVTVAASDLTSNVKLSCTVSAVEGYGSVQVNSSLMASHTQGTADASDTFSISGLDLKVTTNKTQGSYTLTDGLVKANNITLGGSMTATANVYKTWPTKTVVFKYNADGLRTQKKVTLGNKVTTTDYILHGKLVTHMKVTTMVGSAVTGTQEMHFFYDAQSRPAMVDYNGRKYTYVHNLQGDIVAMVDSSGAKVVEYRYDAWGRDIGRTLTSDIGELNPFRYRGYVYDEETRLYYLRSRYYNAGMGRFISGDVCTGEIGQIGSHNEYSYCRNALLVMYDSDGFDPNLFYFYGDDQQHHAERNIKDLKPTFDVKEYYITSPQDFSDAWTDMYSIVGNNDIDIVVINMHGNPYSVTNIDPQKLDYTKHIDTFVLLSCNGGHQNTGFTNVAQAFLYYSGGNISQLIAADGTHNRGTLFHPFLGIKVIGDKEWKKYNNGKGFKSLGFVNYIKNNKGTYDVISIGSIFKSVKALLRKVGW